MMETFLLTILTSFVTTIIINEFYTNFIKKSQVIKGKIIIALKLYSNAFIGANPTHIEEGKREFRTLAGEVEAFKYSFIMMFLFYKKKDLKLISEKLMLISNILGTTKQEMMDDEKKEIKKLLKKI